MSTIICSVGTSILNGFNEYKQLATPLSQWEQTSKLRQKAKAFIQDKYLKNQDNLYLLSAETNSLQKMGVKSDDNLYFICTDTVDGKLCGQMVDQICKEVFHTSNQIKVISGLQVTDKDIFNKEGIPNLVDTILNILERHGWYDCILNPTGGFKAVVPYTTMIGLVFGLEIRYVFEHSNQLIHLPSAPLELDKGIFEPIEHLLPDLEYDYLQKQTFLEKTGIDWEGLEDRFSAILSFEDDLITLSPLGRLFYRRWRQISKYEYVLSYTVLKKLKSGYDRKTFEAIFKKMRDPVHLKAKIHNEVKGKNVDCDCYKGGDTNERIFYYLDGTLIKICDIFMHDEYDYELKKGKIQRANYDFPS